MKKENTSGPRERERERERGREREREGGRERERVSDAIMGSDAAARDNRAVVSRRKRRC